MVGRRRRGETTHLVPIGTAGPGEFFGCPFGSFKSSRLMVASALVNTFDSPKRVSTLRMVVSERRLMMYQLCIPCPVHCTGSSGPERHAVLLREPWFRSCQHCCKRGRGLHQRPESDAGRYGNIVCPPHGQ